MVVPTYLKTRFGADEVITTLLLNFILLIFVQMLEGPLQDPMGLDGRSSFSTRMLPPLFDRMRSIAALSLP